MHIFPSMKARRKAFYIFRRLIKRTHLSDLFKDYYLHKPPPRLQLVSLEQNKPVFKIRTRALKTLAQEFYPAGRVRRVEWPFAVTSEEKRAIQ